MNPEQQRLDESASRHANWTRWGPYLSERQWGTVREDYSPDGECWTYFPHDHARSRAYRWGEDGLLGICDRQCRLSFAWAFWNGHDPILKERLFGLTGPQGNHGEDVKEQYFYLDATPTYSYFKSLYKYPQAEFPYQKLIDENARRGRNDNEFELLDCGVFKDGRYFDILAEYAKAGPHDLLIRLSVTNCGSEPAPLWVLPTLWCRNTWSWGCTFEGCETKPNITRPDEFQLLVRQASLGQYELRFEQYGKTPPEVLFTDNETNQHRVFGTHEGPMRGFKDAFHDHVVSGVRDTVLMGERGTKAAIVYPFMIGAGETQIVKLRLTGVQTHATGAQAAAAFIASGKHLVSGSNETSAGSGLLEENFDQTFKQRIAEADLFYRDVIHQDLSPEAKNISRQAYAGLLFSKQFYHLAVKPWIDGDPEQPPPPEGRKHGRNHDWRHLFNRDVLAMPDKWEYPWFAAWDTAFQMIAMADVDPFFAKEQLLLLLREWYMHPNGQIPAYEFNFSDVNPPVHAWACWRVYKSTAPRGQRDRSFLARAFQKLLINFTWWVNRKDVEGQHLFSGGFLGLDNIGVFDRSKPLPSGGRLEQADGTAWMAFYCSTMLSMALELSQGDEAYEDVASKFFEHFVAIVDATNSLNDMGLWDERDGFYYDHIHVDNWNSRLRIRSMVGIIPLFAVEVLDEGALDRVPGFAKRMDWFLKNRGDLHFQIAYMEQSCPDGSHTRRLLALPSKDRLIRVLKYVLDENEFLSPYGIRSLSRFHRDRPYSFWVDSTEYRVSYVPGESDSGLFGGNSNWRGPIWMPVNYLLIEALERYHHYYGDDLKVEMPTGSGKMANLREVAHELARRLTSLFEADGTGHRPCHGYDKEFAIDPRWKDHLLFYEYFHGETGRGLGASHQTGWTALVARLFACQETLDRKFG